MINTVMGMNQNASAVRVRSKFNELRRLNGCIGNNGARKSLASAVGKYSEYGRIEATVF